ncbi:MAG TPA: lysylphosphatidylglycerol synthase transmembrane domain-containing protein [Gemmatimonadaceae bacterium]|nr:lysylphosphatidylglycerol synthase transmembrane domain-containing protein [Gemmatimonadaceae bacterium]
MTARTARLWQWSVSVLLCAFVAIYARTVAWGEIVQSVRDASAAWIALAVAAFMAGVVVRGVLWWTLLRAVGAPSFSLALRGMVLVTALQSIAVANAGEAGRVALVTRRTGIRVADVLATIAVERLLVTAVHVLMSLVIGFAVPLPPDLARWRVWILAGLVATAGLLGMLVRRSPPGAPQPGRIKQALQRFGSAIRAVSSARRLLVAGSLALIWWVCNAAVFHCAALAVGLPISPGASAIAFMMVSAGSIAHATPGNVGIVQVAYASTAHALGLPTDQAIGVALLAQAVQSVPVMIAALPILPELLAARG